MEQTPTPALAVPYAAPKQVKTIAEVQPSAPKKGCDEDVSFSSNRPGEMTRRGGVMGDSLNVTISAWMINGDSPRRRGYWRYQVSDVQVKVFRKGIDVRARRRSGAVKHPGVGRGEDIPKLSGHVDGRDPTRFSRFVKLEEDVERPRSVGYEVGKDGESRGRSTANMLASISHV